MLETPRLTIRHATLEDAQNLFELNLDPDVVKYTGDSSFKTVLEARELIRERMLPQFEQHRMSRFIVFLKDGTFIGWCGLKFHPETNEVDLGYRFMKKHWGKGYAFEAAQAALAYGFLDLNLKRIIAKAMPENIASIKVIQKLKMTFRGYVKDPTDLHSYILYDQTREEYLKCVDS